MSFIEIVIHALLRFRVLTTERKDGLCCIFERFSYRTTLRVAHELRILREYVRGDEDAVRDIVNDYELYERLFPEPKEDD